MYPQRSVMTCGLATALEPPHFNHAPVRGAIGASFSRRSRAGSFNPRTRVATGGRAAAWHRRSSCFNPRTRVGCDSCLTAWHRRSSCFNPRTRVGCDAVTDQRHAPPRLVSIHAPAWGATPVEDRQFPMLKRFQSTHPRGVRRPRAPPIAPPIAVSIHAPAWGATRRSRMIRR